jgi:CRP-like cAMP-binding protein
MKYTKFNNGDYVYMKDDHADGIYFIVAGRVDFMTLFEGEMLTFNTMTNGSYFGEAEFLLDSNRYYSAYAQKNTELFHLDHTSTVHMFEEHPRIER